MMFVDLGLEPRWNKFSWLLWLDWKERLNFFGLDWTSYEFFWYTWLAWLANELSPELSTYTKGGMCIGW